MQTIEWWPQAKQAEVLHAAGLVYPFTEAEGPSAPVARLLGVGGAAGGGKTDALLAAGIIACGTWAGCQVGFFRRTFPELSGPGGAILRSFELLTGIAHWTGTNHRWTFQNGSILQFCHCQREKDVHQYQSQQFDILIIDEATHFTEFQVEYLLTRNRATVAGLIPLCILATNPGGIGHLWFKDRFVDLGAPNETHEYTTETGAKVTHRFIPARLEDNKILELRDPGYRANLEAKPEALKRALLLGDWDVFEGQVFTEWRRDLHVVKPFELGEGIRVVALDWGYSVPWAALWIWRGRLDVGPYSPEFIRRVVYREAYQAGLTDPEQAERIHELTPEGEWIDAYPADPSMWTARTVGKKAISTADVYKELGIRLSKGENDRITGKRRVHEGLALLPDGQPGLLFFENCRNTIRTLPALPYDDTRVEDVNTDAEDHAYDALRYGLSYKPPANLPPKPAPDDYWAQARGKTKGKRRRRLDVPIEVAELQDLTR